MIYVFGRGRVGRHLAYLWKTAGLDVTLRASSSVASGRFLRGDVVVLAVPDTELRRFDSILASRVTKGVTAFHCAGRLPPSVLADTSRVAECGVLHPLVSIAGVGATKPSFFGVVPTFVVDGSRGALRVARRLVRAAGAACVPLAAHGARYHAAASIIAAGQVALWREASAVFESLGMTAAEAKAATLGLSASVLGNASRLSLGAALSGSVVRGDVDAVRAHRQALSPNAEALGLYDAIARSLLPVASERGVEARKIASISKALSETAPSTKSRRAR